jgi:hypothetical protein
MADETPKAPALAPIHATGLGQTSLTSLLSPMNNISPLTISSPGYASGMASPVVAFGQQGLNKFDATIVQMRQAQQQQQQQQVLQQLGQGSGDQTVRSPLPPPIVSIPLPRE